MERINTTEGFFSGMHTGEGLVCRFTGPGDIYIQTRNPEALSGWIVAQGAGGEFSILIMCPPVTDGALL
jgi:uncharacterized protein (AIM24 family)